MTYCYECQRPSGKGRCPLCLAVVRSARLEAAETALAAATERAVKAEAERDALRAEHDAECDGWAAKTNDDASPLANPYPYNSALYKAWERGHGRADLRARYDEARDELRRIRSALAMPDDSPADIASIAAHTYNELQRLRAPLLALGRIRIGDGKKTATGGSAFANFMLRIIEAEKDIAKLAEVLAVDEVPRKKEHRE